MKSTMRKLVVTWFVLCLIGVLLPSVTVKAETEGGYEYTILSDDTVEITKYTGTATTLTIPNQLGGKDVTSIGYGAFESATTIKTVKFPDTLIRIYGDNFPNLTSIHIPANVTYINYLAFGKKYVESITVDENNQVFDCRENCNAIIMKVDSDEWGNEMNDVLKVGCKNTKIPSDVKYIGDAAFRGCSDLKSIEIPDGVQEILFWAFAESGLTEIALPESVTCLDMSAFARCENLTKVELSEGLETISNSVFSSCINLTSVNIPQSVEMIWQEAFYGCSNLEEITIPDGVGQIGPQAFAGCTKLEEIYIPASVWEIGAGAFVDCSSIVVDSNNSYYDSRENCNAVISKNEYVEQIRETMSGVLVSGCKNTTIPSGVTVIGEYAFYECKGLNNIELPESVVYIGDQAFDSCENLTSIDISEGVTTIGEEAFWGCENLTSFDIPEGVTTIGEDAFHGCEKLKDIYIPASVSKIGAGAFTDCSSIVVDSDNPIYDSRENCNAVIMKEGTIESDLTPAPVLVVGCENTTIPSDVTRIGASAFFGCDGLTSIEIPKQVTYIDNYAFAGCPDDMVIYVESDSYAEKWAKESKYAVAYTVPDAKCKVKVLSNDVATPTVAYMKSTDTTAKAITIPNQVTIGDTTYNVVEISDSAFSDCSSLEEVVLPETLERVGTNAFAGVAGEDDTTTLKVTVPESLEDVSEIGIENVSNVEYIVVYVVDGGAAEQYFQNCNITVNVYPPSQPSTDDKTDENKQPSTDDKTDENKQPSTDDKTDENKQPSSGGTTDENKQPSTDENKQPSSESNTEVTTEEQGPVVGEQYTVKDLIYKVTSSEKVTVVGASKKKITKVTIPTKVEILGTSFKVTAVDKKAFKKCTKLKTVVIGSNVTSIGDEAFMKCTKLQKVTIGKNVKTIGKKVFYGDKKLKNIIFKGTKVTKIGKKAMKGVSGAKIKVPNNKAKNKYTKLLKKAK